MKVACSLAPTYIVRLLEFSWVLPQPRNLQKMFFLRSDMSTNSFPTWYKEPCRYPFEFITQYAVRTKRYNDGIFTVSLRHTIEPSLQDIISQNNIFSIGKYPTTVREFDGNVRPSPVSTVRRPARTQHSSFRYVNQTTTSSGDLRV